MPKTEVTSGCFERLKAISPVPVAMSRPGPVPCALPAARAAALFHRRCLPRVMVVLRKSYRRAIRENILSTYWAGGPVLAGIGLPGCNRKDNLDFVWGAGGVEGILQPAQANVGGCYRVKLIVDAFAVGVGESDAEIVESFK